MEAWSLLAGIPGNGHFLYSALQFDNHDIIPSSENGVNSRSKTMVAFPAAIANHNKGFGKRKSLNGDGQIATQTGVFRLKDE